MWLLSSPYRSTLACTAGSIRMVINISIPPIGKGGLRGIRRRSVSAKEVKVTKSARRSCASKGESFQT